MQISRTLHGHCHDFEKHTEFTDRYFHKFNHLSKGWEGDKKYDIQMRLKLIILSGVFGEPDRQLHLHNRITGHVN